MNDTIGTILERRSIRDYQDRPVPRADMERIIEAGLYAPSGRNRQASHFLSVLNKEIIERITLELKAAIARMEDSPYRAYVGAASYAVNFNAPAFVIVSINPASSLTPAADAAVALENMFLAARSLGIGSCWVNQVAAANDDKQFSAFLESLGRPAGYRVYGSAAFGFPAGDFPKPGPRKGLVGWVE